VLSIEAVRSAAEFGAAFQISECLVSVVHVRL
jgi:hypothetical protein